MVHILKTLHAGNVPAVALKITNLPFADDFERVYAMVSNMLDRSEKDSSFLAGLHTQVNFGLCTAYHNWTSSIFD